MLFGRSARSSLQQMPKTSSPMAQGSQQASLQQAFQQRQAPPSGMPTGLMGQQMPSGLQPQQMAQQAQPMPFGPQAQQPFSGLEPQQMAQQLMANTRGLEQQQQAAAEQSQRQREQQVQQMQAAMQQSPYYAQLQDINSQISQLVGGQFITPEMEQNPQIQALRQQERQIGQSMQAAMQQSPYYAQMSQQPMPLGQLALQQAFQQRRPSPGGMQMGMGLQPQQAAGFGNPQMALQQAFMQQQQPMLQGQAPIGIPGQTMGFLGSQQGGLAALVSNRGLAPSSFSLPASPMSAEQQLMMQALSTPVGPPQPPQTAPASSRRGFFSFGSRR